MDHTNEGATRLPATSSPSAAAQPLQVNPDNVVELALLFRNAADRLLNELTLVETELQLSAPWMDDEASKWMQEFFNEYFLNGESSFRNTLRAIHSQHDAHATALEKAAALYGKTEEWRAAQQAQVRDQLRG